jgi:hypothetical protein
MCALAVAKAADPKMFLKWVEAGAARQQKCCTEADDLFRAALAEEPGEVKYARKAATAALRDPRAASPREPRVWSLLERFPDDGLLICFHAIALADDGDARGAARELERARQLGFEPTQVLGPEDIRLIQEQAATGWLERFAWITGGFAAFYAAVLALMALAGFVLARRTHGTRALDLVSAGHELVTGGQVVRARHESSLTRLYTLALFGGADPLLRLGLVHPRRAVGPHRRTSLPHRPAAPHPDYARRHRRHTRTGRRLAGVREPFRFAGSGQLRTAQDAGAVPKLYDALSDVASRMHTGPVDAVYLAPGSSISVHQEGRGPFGVFGVERRVLTLGRSTMHFLTVRELKIDPRAQIRPLQPRRHVQQPLHLPGMSFD